MYTHGAFIPKLGIIGIFCESRNNIESEFIADRVESMLLLHKHDLLEKSVGVGAPRISAVKEPISGTGYESVVVHIPTHTVSTVNFSYKDPRMLAGVEMNVGIGISGLKLKVKA